MFSINCLEIMATKEQWINNKPLYKNLLSESDYDNFDTYQETHPTATFSKRFFFNDFYYHNQYGDLKPRPKEERTLPDDFFGENINIQAIVGKNGSGKSSLMDLIYLVINDFCYLFERGNKRRRPGAAEMYFVRGLYATLYFSTDAIPYELVIEDNRAIFKKSNATEPIIKTILNELGSSITQDQKKFATKRFSDTEISNIVDQFFYTIVSNYSMQSFVDSNYIKKVFRHIDDIDVQKGNYKKEYTNYDYNKEFDNISDCEQSWISPIFHKNDGYIRPIVLNPYRDNGIVDLTNEFELSKDHFCSLMIFSKIKENVYFFKPYSFAKIKAIFSPHKFSKWCHDIYVKNISRDQYDYIDSSFFLFRISDWLKKYGKEHLLTKKIIDKFNLKQSNTHQDLFWYSIIYIEFKLIKIATKYTSFLKFRNLFKFQDQQDTPTISISDETLLVELLTIISNDKSHITKKIRRVVNFLLNEANYAYDEQFVFHITINNYKKIFENLDVFSPQEIDDFLPPPFFEWRVYLNKLDKTNNIIIEKESSTPLEISYNQLSSGEIQFLQTLSIHAYHIMNLASISDDSGHPKYKNFNLVFDELEISFHPEMQRQFVNRLINALNDLSLSGKHYINIFVITHSPFVLSDIPACNTLFLEDGSSNTTKKGHTFAQNIGDMMYDSFFMEKTIGDFAEGKIRKLIKKRFEKDPTKKQLLMSDAEEQAVLNCIGDPVIRSLIDEIEANDD